MINEVLLAGKWKVYDSDYGIAFGASLKELESNPHKVYQTYKNAGRPDDEAKHWQEIFASEENNWHYPTSANYAEKGYMIFIVETLSFYLIWIIPFSIIFIGILMNKYQFTKRSS